MINESVTTSYDRDSRYNIEYDDYPNENIIYAYDRTERMERHDNIINDEFINYLKQMDSSFIILFLIHVLFRLIY